MKHILPIIMLLSSSTNKAEDIKIPVLELNQEKYVTDTNGVANPSSIIRLLPSNTIKIYLPDGTELKGVVTKIEEINKEVFKVFGDIQNKTNTGFGFVLAKDGIFAGAIVFRDEDITYTLKYSESAKGFIFVKSPVIKLLATK
jgi:hypothetical protein